MTENKICPDCGHSNKSSARHCAKCGKPIRKRKLDTIEKALIIGGVLLFIFFISWISSTATASNLRASNLEKTNQIKTLENDLNAKNVLLQNCNQDNKDKITELINVKKEYDKRMADFNSQSQTTISNMQTLICGQEKLDLNIVDIGGTGFKNYYILKDNSNCHNNGILYTPILAKSRFDNQYGLMLTQNTTGIINLDLNNTYTIFMGFYFNQFSIDYNGPILEFGIPDNNYNLYKDQNLIYFKQGIYNYRASLTYDINYDSINYLKIGVNNGELFIKNYTSPKYPDDTIDTVQTKDFGYIGNDLMQGTDATVIPNTLKYIQIGPNNQNSERIADIFALKVYNVDLRDKDLNYFLNN